MYDFPRTTSSSLIDKILGNWRAEVIYLMNYARNANLWFDTFEYEIIHEEAGNIVNAIYNKYEAINDRLQRNNNDRILHRTSMQDFNKIFETGKDWNFK